MESTSRPRTVPGIEAFQREQLAHLFGVMVGMQVFALPLYLLLLFAATVVDPRPARVALATVTAVLGAFLSLYGRHRFFRDQNSRLHMPMALLTAGLQQGLILLLTGGLSSPLLPVDILLAVGVSATVRSRTTFWFFMGFFAVALYGLALIQLQGWLAIFSPSWLLPQTSANHEALRLFTVATIQLILLAMALLAGTRLQQVLEAMLGKAVQARDDVLKSLDAQSRELTALSGSIAHELKNPLTSIKGLAGLLTLDIPPGKPEERLSTLRREVDRMQGLLEEFLTFSRPLVPLSQEEISLERISEEVAALHEAMLKQHGLTIELEGSAQVRGDPRKIQQILINLVQNALEASPAESSLQLSITVEEAQAVMRLRDHGPGLKEGWMERVFEPGVTTKAKGSGLGLTIARALARQQGGDLSLRTHPDGGCEASLYLPLRGVE